MHSSACLLLTSQLIKMVQKGPQQINPGTKKTHHVHVVTPKGTAVGPGDRHAGRHKQDPTTSCTASGRVNLEKQSGSRLTGRNEPDPVTSRLALAF